MDSDKTKKHVFIFNMLEKQTARNKDLFKRLTISLVDEIFSHKRLPKFEFKKYIYIFATVQRRCMPYLHKHMVEVKFSTTKKISLLLFFKYNVVQWFLNIIYSGKLFKK